MARQLTAHSYRDGEMRLERNRKTGSATCDGRHPARRDFSLHAHGKDGEQRQQFHDGDVLALAEGLHRQDREYRKCKWRQRPAVCTFVNRRVLQGAPNDRKRDEYRGEHQAVGHDFCRQPDRARDGDSRQIDQDRHRRIGFEHIDIQTLTAENPFADGKQPAHVGVRSQDMSQHNGRCKQDDDRNPGQQRGCGHRAHLPVRQARPCLGMHGHDGVRRRSRQTLGDRR